jgi:hypothetical protein
MCATQHGANHDNNSCPVHAFGCAAIRCPGVLDERRSDRSVNKIIDQRGDPSILPGLFTRFDTGRFCNATIDKPCSLYLAFLTAYSAPVARSRPAGWAPIKGGSKRDDGKRAHP